MNLMQTRGQLGFTSPTSARMRLGRARGGVGISGAVARLYFAPKHFSSGQATRSKKRESKEKGTIRRKKLTTTLVLVALAGFTTGLAIAQESEKPSGQEVTVTGQVLDMSCYIDHGTMGEKHAACAKKCIASGLPVGIKANDSKTYLLIGDHKPANSELADYAARTVTVKGKLASRDGINMIENAIVQK
jgi:hypothetical protein